MLFIFLGGLYFYLCYAGNNHRLLVEGLTTANGALRCPNLLIQKGSKYFLYNSNVVQVPGVNPIEFNNLEEYTEFLEWQRGVGIRCPVLYLQNTYDAQGSRVYKVRPSVSELEGGLPPVTAVSLPLKFDTPAPEHSVTPSYNQAQYDQSSKYVPNTLSPADQIKHSEHNLLYSDNAMDPNWGGAKYTQALVDAGYYKGDDVSTYVP